MHVSDGDGLAFAIMVIDWDDASANDLQCLGFSFIPPRGRFEWSQVDGEGFTLESVDWGSGSCRVEGSVKAVLP